MPNCAAREAYDFLKLLTTGHSGSITSYHASSATVAIERFALMAKEHPEAAAYDDAALKRLLFLTIDVVAHMEAHALYNEAGEQIGQALGHDGSLVRSGAQGAHDIRVRSGMDTNRRSPTHPEAANPVAHHARTAAITVAALAILTGALLASLWLASFFLYASLRVNPLACWTVGLARCAARLARRPDAERWPASGRCGAAGRSLSRRAARRWGCTRCGNAPGGGASTAVPALPAKRKSARRGCYERAARTRTLQPSSWVCGEAAICALPGSSSCCSPRLRAPGKGVGIVIPNLLSYPDSVVVLDIKRENYALTAGFRRAHGQEVYLFDPFAEDGRTHRYNPLSAISDGLFRVGDILAIGYALYPPGGHDDFWKDQARNLFLGIVLLLCEWRDARRAGRAHPFLTIRSRWARYCGSHPVTACRSRRTCSVRSSSIAIC